MSVHDDLRAVRRCVDELTRCVSRLERRLDGGPDIRRLRGDTDRLRESLALLTATVPGRRSAPRAEVIGVPEAPYDQRLWQDADDEGLGARHGPEQP